jgi:hypothetical protein
LTLLLQISPFCKGWYVCANIHTLQFLCCLAWRWNVCQGKMIHNKEQCYPSPHQCLNFLNFTCFFIYHIIFEMGKQSKRPRCTPKIGCIITMAGSVIGSIAYIYNLSPTMQCMCVTCSTVELQFIEFGDLGVDAIVQTINYLCHTMRFNMSAIFSAP